MTNDEDVRITAEDQQRIESMVVQYRRQVENLYRMAYLQGGIDQLEEDRRKMAA